MIFDEFLKKHFRPFLNFVPVLVLAIDSWGSRSSGERVGSTGQAGGISIRVGF